MSRSYEIAGGRPFRIEEPIKGPSGKTEYVLSCSNHPADDVFDAGLFLCRLNEEENAGFPESSLLGEDDSAVWFTRGLFRVDELTGSCGTYPEYGARRTFRLRGLRLALSVSKLERTRSGDVRRLTLAMSVRPDASATSGQAEQTGYLWPMPGKCRPIRKGNLPRMCRDWDNLDGSWVECETLGR